jgi:hypothetical protein
VVEKKKKEKENLRKRKKRGNSDFSTSLGAAKEEGKILETREGRTFSIFFGGVEWLVWLQKKQEKKKCDQEKRSWFSESKNNNPHRANMDHETENVAETRDEVLRRVRELDG